MKRFFVFVLFLSVSVGFSQNTRLNTAKARDVLVFLKGNYEISSISDKEIVVFLTENLKVQGVYCRGDKKHGYQTVFYPDGKLKLCWLAKDQIIHGIPCKKTTFWGEVFRYFKGSARVEFYRNGKLKRCKLAKDFVIDGKTYKKGDILFFDKHGKLLKKLEIVKQNK